jgi:nicotinate-nucleotide adenylyltransferase
MREEFPDDLLSLLIGADAAADLPDWREASALGRLARIVVLTRPGVPLPEHGLVDEYLPVPAVEISATEIRERVARGDPIEEFVPPVVAAYIASHALYRT